MLNTKPIIRTNQLRPGCVIPVGWVLESILLILLVCAVRDLSSNVERMTRAVLLVAAQALPSGHGGGPLAQVLPSGRGGGSLAASQALPSGHGRMSDLQGQCEDDGR